MKVIGNLEASEELVEEMESYLWVGTFLKDLFLSVSVFLIADFAQAPKQPAYHKGQPKGQRF